MPFDPSKPFDESIANPFNESPDELAADKAASGITSGLTFKSGQYTINYPPVQRGETFDQYRTRMAALVEGKSNKEEFLANLDSKKSLFGGSKYNAGGGSATDPGQTDPAGGGYSQQIKDFYAMMMDPNHPALKQAMASGVNTGQRLAANAGLEGGLSAAGSTKMGLDSYNQLATQRAGLGLQALQTGSNRELGLGTNALGWAGLDAQKANTAYQQGQDQLGTAISAAGQLGTAIVKNLPKGGSNIDLSQAGSTPPAGYPTGAPEGPPSSPSDWAPPPNAGEGF